MNQVLLRQGNAVVENVPAPHVKPGCVLVKVVNSCISVGTEISGLKQTELPLWKRAMQQPEKVKRAMKMMATQGFALTRSFIQSKMTTDFPTGYSAAGIVVEVGEGVEDIFPGERVACAGAQCAHHADFICVPRNLVVPVPEQVPFDQASTVTVGAIALQGLRRLNPTLGETFVIVGLGILGQLAAQLLKANGCQVIGIDLDRARIQATLDLGLDVGFHPDDEEQIEHVMRLTEGIGADGVVITAATPSDEIMANAFKMCRKKGRVVLVGDVGLNLRRWDFYFKELDILISCSYGPGRYDQTYEEKGLDYPIGYVRWTENRNMGEYLRLIATGGIKLASLIGSTYPVEQATQAYQSLKTDGIGAAPIVLLSYEKTETVPLRLVTNPKATPAKPGQVKLALIGAGNFAKFMHLPKLKELASDYCLYAIMSQTGYNAASICQQVGAQYSTTEYQKILDDKNIDALLITTRHNLHADMALAALKAGKHVLVEKPLALTRGELEKIEEFYRSQRDGDTAPLLLTGFNRRFSTIAQRAFDIVKGRSNPMIINYRMNAGYIALDNWAHGPEGGGRNIGEACHIYDLFTFLTQSKVAQVSAHAITPHNGFYTHRDNFVATVSFEDGSVANLIYTALGTAKHSKEQMDIYVDGKVLSMDDFKTLTIAGAKAKGVDGRIIDKGHKEELQAFARAIQKGSPWPIPLWQQVQTTELSFKIEELLQTKSKAS